MGDGAWRLTPAYFRAATVAVVLITIALLFERPDLLVIATPAAVVTIWSAVTRPTDAPSFEDHLGRGTIREGEATWWRTEMTNGGSADLATVAVADMNFFQRKPTKGAAVVAAESGEASMQLQLRSTRWGRRDLEPASVSASSPWGAFHHSTELTQRSIVTLPVPAAFDSDARVRPSHGLVGSDRSTKGGEGSEFSSVRAFQTGDRMRRINWTRSLRSDTLQVNATWADQDTHIALVIDVDEDLGVSEGIEGAASSLDTTVRAAGAIAEHYVRSGNRVSLRSLDPAVRIGLPAATGQAHLRRLLDTLARVNAPAGRLTSPRGRAMANADVSVVLSPLSTPLALERAVAMGRSGTSVVVVDTLPDHVVDNDDPLLVLAWRIRLLERRRELRIAEKSGVAVCRWLGPGSLDHFLRNVARQAAAPRVRP